MDRKKIQSVKKIIKNDKALNNIFSSIATMAEIVVSGQELLEQKERICTARDVASLERAYNDQEQSIDFLGHMVGEFDEMVKRWHDCPEIALVPDKETLKDRKSMLDWAKNFLTTAPKTP